MCGIAGIVIRPDRDVPDLQKRLLTMVQAMHHRGPDDRGVYVAPGGRAGLANCRLAIRDLSPAGHMPMGNAQGSVWITYNGEIYNTDELRPELERMGYIFHSRSDTEVILHGYEAWGESVVKRLRGMFALAILDQREPGRGRLLLARDPMGIKPLYYAWTDEALVLASELKGLLASGLASREISPAGLVGYLMLGSVPNPLTIYREATALPPASSLALDLDRPGSPQPAAYWHLPADTLEPASYADAVEQTRSGLTEAVRVRLVSDVPLGAFLSGGLDSSAVVAMMRQATAGPLRTCSMVFEEAEYSEAPYARAVAEAVGAEHFERVVTAGDLADEFDHILRAMDQPSVDGVNTYFVSQTARQAGLTVALSGLGGDELFGGYPNTFRGAPAMQRALQLVQAIPGGPSVAGAAIKRLPDRRRWAKVQDALARPASPASAYLARRGLFSPSEVQALVSPDMWHAAINAFDPVEHIMQRAGGPADIRPSSFVLRPSSMNWTSRAELRTYTHHQLLRDTDAMSMCHSLEVRVPLLDVCLVEAVLRLPERVKTNHGPGPKPLLAQALGDGLPALVRGRRDKQGFTFPFAPWLKGPLKARATAMLEAALGHDWLQPEMARGVFQGYQDGAVHWSRPWTLVALAAVNVS
jgi:asparagine synthase (glutamine-hydrolysing)